MPLRIVIPLLLVLWHLLSGLLNGAVSDNQAAAGLMLVVNAVVDAVLLYAWTADDARRRGATVSTAMIVCLVLFGIFAMPFYLINARPRAAAWRWIVKGLLIALACYFGYLAMFRAFAG